MLRCAVSGWLTQYACAGFPVANIKGLLQNTAVPQTYIDLGTAQKTTLPAPVRARFSPMRFCSSSNRRCPQCPIEPDP